MKQYWHTVSLLAAMLGMMLIVGCNRQQPASQVDSQPVDQAVAAVAEADDDYPLDICVISGNKLDSMGGAVTLEHEGQQVRICCPPCEDAFRADPTKYLDMVAKARQSLAQ